MPQFNTRQFNATQFNVNTVSVLFADAVAQADALQGDDVQIVKQEIQNMAITIAKLLNNNPFLDDAMSLDSTLIKAALLVKLDTMLVTDTDIGTLPTKVLIETMTPADVKSFILSVRRNDNMTLSSTANAQITNKGLSDSINTAIWLTIKRTTSGVNFGDE